MGEGSDDELGSSALQARADTGPPELSPPCGGYGVVSLCFWLNASPSTGVSPSDPATEEARGGS